MLVGYGVTVVRNGNIMVGWVKTGVVGSGVAGLVFREAVGGRPAAVEKCRRGNTHTVVPRPFVKRAAASTIRTNSGTHLLVKSLGTRGGDGL